MFNKENNLCCLIFTIIASLLLGVGIAAVFFSGLVATISVLFYFALIVGILALILIAFLLFCKRYKACFCINNTCLITSILGSIISSIFALTLTTVAASIPAAILVGVVAFFFLSTLVHVTSLIICLLCTKRCD